MRRRKRYAGWSALVLAMVMLCAQPLSADPPNTLLPPAWDQLLLYYRNFDRGETGAVYRGEGIEETTADKQGPGLLEKGFVGRSALLGDPYEVVLKSSRLVPTKPYTVSFWWAMHRDAPVAGSIQWVALQADGNSKVHFYSRGKGKWCALTAPALVLQVVGLEKTKLFTAMARNCQRWFSLDEGDWHHTAMVFRNSRTVELYLDGTLWRKLTLTGVGFVETSKFDTLVFGPLYRGNQAIRVDEISVLDAALEPAQIADYYRAMKALHSAGLTE